MYNPFSKNHFIADLGEGTLKIYNRIFELTEPLELEFNKDLAMFDIDQLYKVFVALGPKSRASAVANVTYVEKYLSWSKEIGFIDKNPLTAVTHNWKEQFAPSLD